MPGSLNCWVDHKIIDPSEPKVPQFCDCEYPSSLETSNHRGKIHELTDCRCGEDASCDLQWNWQHSIKDDMFYDCVIYDKGQDLTFHPVYSQGTPIVRGSKPLKSNMIHYWEIRTITCPGGTDQMFGIGTDQVNLRQYQHSFLSALGSDKNSWGFSYLGVKQHNGKSCIYGNRIGQGCIIGIYLDLTIGYLEYFVNRRSLGVAYTNIPTDSSTKIYPMICSTSAKSSFRLINATSFDDSLEFRAYQSLSRRSQLSELKNMPGLQSLSKKYWFLSPPAKYSNRSNDNKISLEDEIILLNKKMKYSRQYSTEDEEEEEDDDMEFDIYRNVNKISYRKVEENDEHESYHLIF